MRRRTQIETESSDGEEAKWFWVEEAHTVGPKERTALSMKKSDGPEFKSFGTNAGVAYPHRDSRASVQNVPLQPLFVPPGPFVPILQSPLQVTAVLFLAITKPFFRGAVPKTTTFQS